MALGVVTFCNVRHPAIAFLGADCPVCIPRAAFGVNMGSTSVERLRDTWFEWVRHNDRWVTVESDVTMIRPTHDEYFLALLAPTAQRGTCSRRKVAAILVDDRQQILATGYNGVPRGFTHCTDTPCPGANDPKGDTSRCLAVHAEINALLQADVSRAHTLYVSASPCFACAKAIANTPIKRVICQELYHEPGGDELTGWAVLRNANIEIKASPDLATRIMSSVI